MWWIRFDEKGKDLCSPVGRWVEFGSDVEVEWEGGMEFVDRSSVVDCWDGGEVQYFLVRCLHVQDDAVHETYFLLVRNLAGDDDEQFFLVRNLTGDDAGYEAHFLFVRNLVEEDVEYEAHFWFVRCLVGDDDESDAHFFLVRGLFGVYSGL